MAVSDKDNPINEFNMEGDHAQDSNIWNVLQRIKDIEDRLDHIEECRGYELDVLNRYTEADQEAVNIANKRTIPCKTMIHEDDVGKSVTSNTVIEDDIIIESVRIMSDADALREINNFTTSRQMSVAEIAEHTVLPFEQIERILQR